ncbi:nucleotidyltransferase family protein [Chloroflexota bacterium]
MQKLKKLNNLPISDHLTREDKILILCARVYMPSERREVLKSLLEQLSDWDLLLEKAIYQRLVCLVAHHLRSEELSAFVPQSIQQTLHNIYYTSLVRNMLLQNELSKLLSSFQQEGIPNIVLKGAAMLGNVYQDISLRSMGDMDILVHPDHLNQAVDVALEQGYSHITSPHSQETARKKLRHLATMQNRETRITLEIHQHIEDVDSPYHFDLRNFWDRAHRINISGADTLILAPEELLIHLSLNFIRDRHYDSRNAIGQLCDISEVITYFRESLNWNLLETMAKELGIESTLHCALYICKQVLDANVPTNVLSSIQPSGFNTSILTLFINRRIFDTRDWILLDWMAPKRKYNLYKSMLTIIYKILRIPLQVFREDGFRKRKLIYYIYLIRNTIPELMKHLKTPSKLREDVILDRWLHDLYNDRTRPAS